MNAAIEPSRVLAEQWFRKAENDLLNVKNNLMAEHYPADTVCFHCQQAAEKYLKGFLARHQMAFAKTHDMLTLLQQVRQLAGEEASVLSDKVLLLDEYSVSIRYPQEYAEEPDEEEVQAAYQAALDVRSWVRSRVVAEGACN
jgi:HEPN domain-containing protein